MFRRTVAADDFPGLRAGAAPEGLPSNPCRHASHLRPVANPAPGADGCQSPSGSGRREHRAPTRWPHRVCSGIRPWYRYRGGARIRPGRAWPNSSTPVSAAAIRSGSLSTPRRISIRPCLLPPRFLAPTTHPWLPRDPARTRVFDDLGVWAFNASREPTPASTIRGTRPIIPEAALPRTHRNGSARRFENRPNEH